LAGYLIMERIMRRLTFLILVVLLIFPVSVSAQQVITIEDMVIQIWPEYDRPEMLVIYSIKLADETQFPITLSFKIPAEAGDPFVVADGEVGDTVVYERTVEGDWGIISFITNSQSVIIEYYDPNFTKEDSARNFTYTWPGDYSVNSLDIIVQIPLGAQSMVGSPEMDDNRIEENGFEYLNKGYSNLNAGTEFELSISYQKSNDLLSIDQMPSQPDTPQLPAPEPTNQPAGTTNWIALGLGVIGLAILGYGVISLNRRSSRPTSRKRSRSRSRSSGRGKAGRYCHNCGTKAQSGNKFCRECGTELR
jgi:hypothetical protein